MTKTADLVLDFYAEECDRLSRKYMETRRAKKAPFLRTLFLANQLRWDTMKQSISSSLQELCDVVCARAHTFLGVQDSLGLDRCVQGIRSVGHARDRQCVCLGKSVVLL